MRLEQSGSARFGWARACGLWPDGLAGLGRVAPGVPGMNAEGHFRTGSWCNDPLHPQLPLGPYEIGAELAGFQTSVRSGITLTVGREVDLTFVLKVGEITERVEVRGEASLVETTSATVSGLVDEKAIRDLPLNGRSFDQLISLQSGTFHFQLTGGALPQPAYNVSGARGGSNRFLIDGTEVAARGVGGGEYVGSISGSNLGVEAIREFRVLTNAYSSEYGKRPGGIVNMATRSGTNTFHGSIFEFHRNDNLDARNFFDPGEPPEFKRNNFGFSFGGPLVTDRTFFFGNYEGLRQRLGLTNIAVVPDEAARQEILPGSQRVTIADPIKLYLFLYPPPNGRNNGDGTAEFISHPSSRVDEDFFLTRVDHQFSDQVVYTRGVHSIRVGGEIQRTHNNVRIPGTTTIFGQYTFSSLADFLQGRPFNLRVATGDPTKGWRQTFAGFYLQNTEVKNATEV
ncbi:MAG: TonB-dependent receptor [Acidobacteria bacterium]|nr:TonB-dependent receptor [Acidobacteriota bacterium]